jgi:DNA-binding NtrC family response regulator
MEYEERDAGISSMHRPTVLIVDDECELRLILGLGLRERGYKVIEADSVYAAKQLMREHPKVEVVICDVRMPGGPDGTELAVWLYRFMPQTILILTSGYFDRAEAEPGPLVYGYRLPKPFRPSQAASLIERCLEKRAEELARTIRERPEGWY